MSLTFNQGDFLSLLGPYGCGKSTALKVIAGVLPVTSGPVDIPPAEGAREHDL